MVDSRLRTSGRIGRAPGPVDLVVRLGKGIGHPTRARVLLACAASAPAPERPVTIARRLDLPLGVVSYHVRTLAGLGLLDLQATSVVRGAVAHDYVIADGVRTALEALMAAARAADGAPEPVSG